MAVTSIAIFGHHLDAEAVAALPAMLTATRAPRLVQAMADLLPFLSPETAPLMADDLGWSFDPQRPAPGALWAAGEVAEFWDHSPLHLLLQLGPHAGSLDTLILWPALLREPDLQTAVRRVGYALAQMLGAPAVIYVPDNAFVSSYAPMLAYEGNTFEQILAWLGEHVGPPDQTFSAIYQRRGQYQTAEGYMLDTFAGLGHTATADETAT